MAEPRFRYRFFDAKKRLVYDGTDPHQLAVKIMATFAMDQGKLNKIAKYAQKEWVRLANSPDYIEEKKHTWSNRDYRADYLAGISVEKNGSDGITLSLKGPKANAVELGWAPPSTSEWADGIGTYDGSHKDLRPWLLGAGDASVKHVIGKKKKAQSVDSSDDDEMDTTGVSKSGATMYRVIRFDAPAYSEVVDQTADHLAKLEDANRILKQQAEMTAKQRTKFVAKLRGDMMSNAMAAARQYVKNPQYDERTGMLKPFKPLDFSSVEPAQDTYGEHMKWVYNNAKTTEQAPFKTLTSAVRYLMHKAKFSVYRTITDSDEQKGRRLFFSAGVAPAGIITTGRHGKMAPLAKILRQAIKNVMLGRAPDGS
jgi:hypothetical protein